MLKINLLGTPAIIMDHKTVEGFISDKALGLLCYLALNPALHSREKLSDLLWSAFPAQRARANLRQALSNLQKLLPGHLEINRKTVRFVVDGPHSLDVAEFSGLGKDLLSRSRTSSQNEEEPFDKMAIALSLYRGEFMSDLFVDGAKGFESWMVSERERLSLLYLEMLLAFAERYERKRDLDTAVELLEKAVRIEPWQEAPHRRLMLLYARTGGFEKALAQFKRCRQALLAELEVEPGPETVALYERIRAARTIRQPHLPSEPDPLIGRSQVLENVIDLLAWQPARLVSVLGIGGAGKTHLAIAALPKLRSAFLEGVYFIPLAGTPDAEGMLLAIARALRLNLNGHAPVVEQLAGYLQNKEILLVLDNLEHLAGGYTSLEEILAAAPQVRILATSRRLLTLRWEHPIFLEGLEIGSPDSVLENPAGRLFLQKALRVRPDFAPVEKDAGAIFQICTYVDGLPLGIELSAVWLRLFSCSQIAAEMETNIQFIQQPAREGLERHASLWAAFNYSWHLLPEEAQEVFNRLSVFSGGFPRWAAGPVAGAGPETLAVLIDMSLLRKEAEDRYEIHQLLRQFGMEKLDGSEEDSARAQMLHARAFLESIAKLEPRLKGSGLDEAAEKVLADWDNVKLAWGWGVANADHELVSLGLGALYEFCVVMQFYREGRGLFSAALERFEPDPSQELLTARLRLALGAFQYYLGKVEAAMAAFNASRPPLREAGPAHDLGVNLMWTGFAMSNSGTAGKLPEGRKFLEESLSLFEARGDAYYQARCLGNLGNNLVNQGDFLAAPDFFRRSLALFDELGVLWGQAGALAMLGKIQQTKLGRQSGKKELERALAIGREIGNLHVISVALGGLAEVARKNGDLAAAEEYLQEALDSATVLGQRNHIADYLGHLGNIASLSGQDERAESYFRRSLEYVEEDGFESFRGALLRYMGIFARDRGAIDSAAHHFSRSLESDLALKQTGGVIHTLFEVALMACRQDQENKLLPLLLAYLANHPLTTESIRTLLSDLSCKPIAEVEMDVPVEEAYSLDQIVRRVQDELISHIR